MNSAIRIKAVATIILINKGKISPVLMITFGRTCASYSWTVGQLTPPFKIKKDYGTLFNRFSLFQHLPQILFTLKQ
jgi:hypothetical protein